MTGLSQPGTSALICLSVTVMTGFTVTELTPARRRTSFSPATASMSPAPRA
jgi:hypothetical protein